MARTDSSRKRDQIGALELVCASPRVACDYHVLTPIRPTSCLTIGAV
jgi:hypothetical protein